MPRPVAEQILAGQEMAPQHFRNATICYIDVVGMLGLEAKFVPTGIMKVLSEINRYITGAEVWFKFPWCELRQFDFPLVVLFLVEAQFFSFSWDYKKSNAFLKGAWNMISLGISPHPCSANLVVNKKATDTNQKRRPKFIFWFSWERWGLCFFQCFGWHHWKPQCAQDRTHHEWHICHNQWIAWCCWVSCCWNGQLCHWTYVQDQEFCCWRSSNPVQDWTSLRFDDKYIYKFWTSRYKSNPSLAKTVFEHKFGRQKGSKQDWGRSFVCCFFFQVHVLLEL